MFQHENPVRTLGYWWGLTASDAREQFGGAQAGGRKKVYRSTAKRSDPRADRGREQKWPVDSPGLVIFSMACSNSGEDTSPQIFFYTIKYRYEVGCGAKSWAWLEPFLKIRVRVRFSKSPEQDPEGGSGLWGVAHFHLYKSKKHTKKYSLVCLLSCVLLTAP